jgi:ribonuclease P protein component
MLPQESRLRKKDEIEFVFRTGKTWHGDFFSIKYTQTYSKEELPVRAAFSFSKKFIKKAILRNRLKRRITNNLRKTEGFSQGGMDLVFYIPKERPFPRRGVVSKELENFFGNVYNNRY